MYIIGKLSSCILSFRGLTNVYVTIDYEAIDSIMWVVNSPQSGSFRAKCIYKISQKIMFFKAHIGPILIHYISFKRYHIVLPITNISQEILQAFIHKIHMLMHIFTIFINSKNIYFLIIQRSNFLLA